ncbi:MAG: D-methionine transport system permease protein [Eubacteriaceae bacterium]|jgi:D-methionine transport system permease protein|nr:D-methionine transport system permease protein [Eubacteriaceae bacterium]
MWDPTMTPLIIKGIFETLYMTLASTFLAYVLGIPMGILLVTSEEGGIKPFKALNLVLNIVVNITRSIPFLILLIAVIPFTRLITGTSIGSTATIVPLVLAAAPFIARLVESSLKEVDQGIIEASLSMGASPMQIVMKVLIPEAKPSLLMGAAIAVTTILGYSAMAGIVGGGGLGDIAIRFGYYRYETGVMIVTVVLLVIIVQFFQEVGMRIAQKSDKRK